MSCRLMPIFFLIRNRNTILKHYLFGPSPFWQFGQLHATRRVRFPGVGVSMETCDVGELSVGIVKGVTACDVLTTCHLVGSFGSCCNGPVKQHSPVVLLLEEKSENNFMLNGLISSSTCMYDEKTQFHVPFSWFKNQSCF